MRSLAILVLCLQTAAVLGQEAESPSKKKRPKGEASSTGMQEAEVTATRLNVRSQPTTKSPRIARVAEGERFVVLEKVRSGEKVGGESRWVRIRVGAGVEGWVSRKHVRLSRPSEKVSTPDTGPARVRPTSADSRKRNGTERWPYRFYASPAISNGGCPGYVTGKRGNMDEEMALSQLLSIVADHEITYIVSLACRGPMAQLGKRLSARTDNAVLHESVAVHAEERHYARNVRIFERLGKLSKEHKMFIHCRHGAHRAIAATMGALIASGRVRTMGEAMKVANGRITNFRPGYARPLLRQVVRYALEKGLEVEDEYRTFVGLNPDQNQTE